MILVWWGDMVNALGQAVQQVGALPWWAQVLPGVNIAGLYLGLRRIARLEFMVETMWNAGSWSAIADRKAAHK